MGIYVNPGNTAFQKALNGDIYIDKTELIAYTNRRIDKTDCFICVSRPRRFGKSMAADMICAYYSRGCDSARLFRGRKAEVDEAFAEHLNKHHVIRLDIQKFLESERDLDTFIVEIEKAVVGELTETYPECRDIHIGDRLKFVLERLFVQTGQGFVFVVDEWDCVFRVARDRKEIQKDYLDFLRGLFKGSSYVELAYMTGILPIKKYGEHSAINIFREFSMLNPGRIATCFGFTEDEVKGLCEKYGVDYGETQKWYDGYQLGAFHIYNPQAVTELMDSGEFQSYWTGTETYEALKIYIDRNFDGLKEAVSMMLGNGRCKIDPSTFQNDMTTFKTKDDILTLLVHLGYLTFDKENSEVFIPNQEVSLEFLRAVKTGGWDGLAQALSRSENILLNTWKMDGEAVAEVMSVIHNETASLLKYNDENSLTCTVLMAYYGAKAYYMNSIMELPSGKGFADVVYLPRRDADKPALVVELKWNKSAKGAIEQIKEKQYAAWVEGYVGEILLVGIVYDKKRKKHDCVIEKYYV
ncbi:MAG: AAA family ATPase [Hungatella sp.]|nr:AAA family ATPase [Hungatella sp.]